MLKLNCNYILSPIVSPDIYAYACLAVMFVFVIYVLVFYRSLVVYLGSAGLVFGGLLNAGERLKTGCVRDYFSFFELFSYNVADILVTSGIILIIFGIEKYENRSSDRR